MKYRDHSTGRLFESDVDLTWSDTYEKIANEHPREMEWKALDRQVLAVAVQGGFPEEWAAYIGAVKGNNHYKEYLEVYKHGTKLPEHLAVAIFPEWSKQYTYRR